MSMGKEAMDLQRSILFDQFQRAAKILKLEHLNTELCASVVFEAVSKLQMEYKEALRIGRMYTDYLVVSNVGIIPVNFVNLKEPVLGVLIFNPDGKSKGDPKLKENPNDPKPMTIFLGKVTLLDIKTVVVEGMNVAQASFSGAIYPPTINNMMDDPVIKFELDPSSRIAVRNTFSPLPT